MKALNWPLVRTVMVVRTGVFGDSTSAAAAGVRTVIVVRTGRRGLPHHFMVEARGGGS